MHNYFSLLRIRFENAVQLRSEIDESQYEAWLIPPISLQLLAENAIKHNEFSDSNPLVIYVQQKGESLTVSNRLNRKELRKESSKTGLSNLNERYKLITQKEITIAATADIFVVQLPLLKMI